MKGMPAAIVAILVLEVGFTGLGVAEMPSKRQLDPLRPLTQCQFGDGLRIVAVDRLPAEVRSRVIPTTEGQKSVSLADGYRVMLAYPDTDYFANMKIEMSEDARYLDDKSTIIQNMQFLAHQSSVEARARVPLEHNNYQGLDVYSINFPTIDFYITNNPPALGGGPIGTYVLFKDSARAFVTVYFLNQRPNRRKFNSVHEYVILRDRFLAQYASCILKGAP